MKSQLSNLDELIQKVRNVHSKNYLHESITAYRTGAYRAALITTWIAVCVDIIEKIRELSVSGDPAAKKIEEKLESINPNDHSAMLAFEREILNFACDELQLISVIEKSHLERLKDDRNICAHPTFSSDGSQFSPPAELALSYIVQASNYLLIHLPLKGKIVVERLFELINEPSFPQEEEKAYAVLSSDNNLGRIKDSGVRSLGIILLKRIFRDDVGISSELMNRIAASLGAIYRLYPEVYEELTSTKLTKMLCEASDPLLKRIFPLLGIRNELWEKIPEPEKIRIEGLVNSMGHEDITKYRVANLADDNYEIRKSLIDKVDRMNDDEKEKMVSSIPSIIFKDIAIDIFSRSTTFDMAETRGSKLILPICSQFCDTDLHNVFSGALGNRGAYGNNQILNAGGIGSFFVSLYMETKKASLDHKAKWLQFLETARKEGYSLAPLFEIMVEDGYVESEQGIDEDEVIPF